MKLHPDSNRTVFLFLMALLFISLVSGCRNQPVIQQPPVVLNDFEKSIAQKIIIDIRYFCNSKQNKNQQCLKPVTHLPVSLQRMISETNIGGIILFSQNIESIKQTIKLNRQLQQQAKTPLFIAIDQEGGRVIRLPGNLATSFSGNMAIGATYPQYHTYFARKAGQIIGQELNLLGINVDLAPDVDVNINPDNPVINIRSFGEDAGRVATLALAMTTGLQQHVIATLKHFPGHGNTHVDSHTGLAVINTPKEYFEKNDLLPFANIIKNSSPGMIMSAHIQYPKLDNSTLISKHQKIMIKPATMSYQILTQLLRHHLKYDGVIITDALNMKSITQHFKPVDAVMNTFVAGADIALMPMEIRYPGDIRKFKLFIKQVAIAWENKPGYKKLLAKSLKRIEILKDAIRQQQFMKTARKLSLQKQLEMAKKGIGNQAHRLLEKQLSEKAITLIKSSPGLIPLDTHQYKKILLMGHSPIQLAIFKNKLEQDLHSIPAQKVKISSLNISNNNPSQIIKSLKNNQIAILLYSPDFNFTIAPRKTPRPWKQFTGSALLNKIQTILKILRKIQKPVILAVMGSPYASQTLISNSDAVITTYNGSIYQTKTHTIAPDFNALSLLLSGKIKSSGQLPVHLKTVY